MYRDDPLDDEFELRALIGDTAVDDLHAAGGGELVGAALDALRVLQGWVDDADAAAWFHDSQRRLGERTPLQALCDGDEDEVLDAARQWAAAQG